MTLPNFIIAGAKKAATTSIYEYMKQHPEIYMSPIKETKFFAFEPDNPEHVYADANKFPVRTLEDYTRLFAGANGAKAIGEASPLYINSRIAAQRIYETIPAVKLIFSLRNPVERAYSAYLMRVRSGNEHRSAVQAFQEDRERLRTSSYYNMLQLWYELFDEIQIKVILFEDFKRNSLAVMQELYAFLDVDSSFTPNVAVQYNTGGAVKNQTRQRMFNYLRRFKPLRFYLPKSLRSSFTKAARANLTTAPALPAEAKSLLADVFRDDVENLQNLIHKDLSVWGLF
jgi:hypothetical protein